MADITTIGSNRIKVKWPNPDKNGLTIRPPNSINKPLFGILTPTDTIEQNKNFSLDVDTSTPNGNTTIYEVNGNTRVKIGTYSVNVEKKASIILDENIKKTFPPDAIKDLTDVNSQFFKTVSNSRNTWIRDKYLKITENSGKVFNGIDDANPNQIVPQESVPESQEKGVANLEELELPEILKNLHYPEVLEENEHGQDYIKFEVLTYVPRIYNFSTLGRYKRFVSVDKDGKTKDLKKKISTIKLPIQGGISDMNSVSWNAEPLDATKQALAFASLSVQQEGVEATNRIGETLGKLATDATVDAGVQKYLQALFSRMAISSDTPFFSRAYGAILNPNLELLFQNADLRPFNFRFDLTPRTEKEATLVKQIIRVFKQTMAVRQGVADIFLKTPMIYDITYINGNDPKNKNKNHKSINKIKTCALKSFSVNYTPNNQYMTYDDEAATMSAYSLDMQFVELEPVYYNDYKGLSDDAIGY
jgi:hypothetical protein